MERQDFNLCARGRHEGFIISQGERHSFVRIIDIDKEACCRDRQPVHVQLQPQVEKLQHAPVHDIPCHDCEVVQESFFTQSPEPFIKSASSPTPKEKVVFKYGKIQVQVKNAQNMRVWEEDGVLRVAMDKT